MCIIKCITNGRLIKIMIIKGHNSWHNEITQNKGDFRDGCWLVGFVALRPKSTAMVIAGRSVHLTTLFPGQA